ncbi:hypothetical protein O3S80_41410 [Streptomyces sp. Lzd4kr]|nr:hypothetical protein [Streptomyces sp. Lzd4kr]
MKVSKYAKAVVAAVVATGGTVATALADDILTSGEVWLIAGAFIGGLGFTWAVPNRQTDEAGR